MSKTDREVVIVSAKRTAIGDFGGVFKNINAVDLGVAVVKEILKETQLDPQKIENVFMGNVLQGGVRQNPARQIAIYSGLPVESTAATINKACGSGMEAMILGIQSILLGDADIVLAGGTENMSRIPYILPNARFGYRLGDGEIQDSLFVDGLIDPFNNYHMGITAENLAEKYNITREEQDKFALLSHQRASNAIKNGDFKDEIVPITVTSKKGDIIIDTDEHVRNNVTLSDLGKLKPAFKKDGTVTAGNASGINDGASAVLLMTMEKANELGLKPLAKVVSYATCGVDPSIMGIGPVPTIKKALDKANLKLEDIDLVELNEAFAAQSLAVLKELPFDPAIVNIFGGAISLGHPVGCSGSRIVVTLLNALKKTNKKIGLASLCIGGGQGVGLIVERL